MTPTNDTNVVNEVLTAGADLLLAIDAHSGVRKGDMHHERRALKKALASLAALFSAPAPEDR